MKKEIKEKIEDAIKELKKIKEVKAVYLFGSQATGKAKPYSDIDICVFTDLPLKRKTKTKILGVSSSKINVSFFHDLPIYIQYRVLKDGLELLMKDKIQFHKYHVKSVKQYLDFKPTLEKHHELTMKNIG